MLCKEAQQLIYEYLDWSLSEEQQSAMKEHLASCQDCRALLAQTQTMLKNLNDLAPQAPDLAAKAADQLRDARKKRASRMRRVVAWTSAAAAVVVVAVISVHFMSGQVADVGGAAPMEIASESGGMSGKAVQDSFAMIPETSSEPSCSAGASEEKVGEEPGEAGSGIAPENTLQSFAETNLSQPEAKALVENIRAGESDPSDSCVKQTEQGYEIEVREADLLLVREELAKGGIELCVDAGTVIIITVVE